jgi:hypothetical protein
VLARAWHATVAGLVLIALVLQIIVAARVSGSPHEVTTGVLRGSTLVGRIIRVLSFFTIQSNILCGVVAAQLAIRPDRDGRVWRPLHLAALCGIAVTGIVYSAVLADIHEPKGKVETTVNTIVHYVVPMMMVLGWLLFGPRPRIDRRTLLLSLLFPVGWLAYTLIRGAVWDWYPYPFVDVTAHGYARVALNSLGVTAVLAAVAAAFWLGDHRLRPAGTQPCRRDVRKRGTAGR